MWNTAAHDISWYCKTNRELTCRTCSGANFKKAFAKVPHRRLVDKLKILPNVDNRILNWIQDFLRSRNQRVVVKNAESATVAVTLVAPQSSVLGPTLFLIYVNDLPDCITATPVFMQMILYCTLQSIMIRTGFSFKPILTLFINGLAQTKCPSIPLNVNW